MSFTAEEQAILCRMAYYNIVSNRDEPLTLEDILRKKEKQLRENLGDDYEDTLDKLIAKVSGKDYKIVRTENDDRDSGFVAFVIADPDKNVTVVCRGSEDLSQVTSNPNSLKDLDTDLQIGFRKETDQQQVIEKLIDKLKADGYDSFSFTGHSLGGNLAIHGAIYLGDPDKVKEVTTFNAPGFNKEYFTIHAMKIKQLNNGKIKNYENEYDVVSSLFNKPGDTIYVESSADGGMHHSVFEFKINKKGFVKTDKKGVRDFIVHQLAYLIVDQRWQNSIMGRYIYSKLTGGNITGYRDFSRSALRTMTEAAQEVEDEPWWRVDRWDCWYRMDQAFGGLVMDYQRLSNNVDAYYRKIIDLNDASVSKIVAIFKEVYHLDDVYSKKIRVRNDRLQMQVYNKLVELAESVNPGIDG